MKKLLKIIFTPIMLLLLLIIMLADLVYYRVLKPIYDFTWDGWHV